MEVNLAIALFISAVCATIGCGVIRLRHRATYDVLLIVWLMLFLTWTVINNFAIFEWLTWPTNAVVCTLSIASAEVAFRFYFANRIQNSVDPVWSPFLFGGFLMLVSGVFAFSARFFVTGINQTIGVPFNMTVMSTFLLGTIAIGIWGILIIIQSRSV